MKNLKQLSRANLKEIIGGIGKSVCCSYCYGKCVFSAPANACPSMPNPC